MGEMIRAGSTRKRVMERCRCSEAKRSPERYPGTIFYPNDEHFLACPGQNLQNPTFPAEVDSDREKKIAGCIEARERGRKSAHLLPQFLSVSKRHQLLRVGSAGKPGNGDDDNSLNPFDDDGDDPFLIGT